MGVRWGRLGDFTWNDPIMADPLLLFLFALFFFFNYIYFTVKNIECCSMLENKPYVKSIETSKQN